MTTHEAYLGQIPTFRLKMEAAREIASSAAHIAHLLEGFNIDSSYMQSFARMDRDLRTRVGRVERQVSSYLEAPNSAKRSRLTDSVNQLGAITDAMCADTRRMAHDIRGATEARAAEVCSALGKIIKFHPYPIES